MLASCGYFPISFHFHDLATLPPFKYYVYRKNRHNFFPPTRSVIKQDFITIAFPASPLYTDTFMDSYPVDLILATATAWSTIFLGFLPTKTIRTSLFAGETLKATIAWILVAMSTPPAIMHYPLFFAIICAGSWWKFRATNALSGKMWLSIASGLGISIGVMLIIALREETHPQHLSQIAQAIHLASVYLGGGIIGLAYSSYVLMQNSAADSGVTQSLAQRYVGLLFILVLIRAVVLGVELLAPVYPFNSEVQVNGILNHHGATYVHVSDLTLVSLTAIPMAVVIAFAFLAWRASRVSARTRTCTLLIATCLIAFASEMLIRFLLG